MELDRAFFSSVNYQTLLGIPEVAADMLSIENQAFREFCVSTFDRRLAFLVEHFSIEGSASIPQPEHSGWEQVSKQIASIMHQQQSVILALFHFGLHRSIIVDLACKGIPLVAPIAGKAYWDFYHKKHIAPAEFGECFNLVEVDSLSVGKQLVKQMRKGHLITIYADGNMGPDGVHVEEGGVSIQFFGREIQVKEGISRLAAAFKLPVLPLFSLKQSGFESGYSIVAGELLNADPHLMQKLYQQLEAQVKQRPQDWEYITCCHRWMDAERDSDSELAPIYDEKLGLRLNQQNVRLVQQGNNVLLLNLKTQTAFKLPDWSKGLSCILRKGGTADEVKQWLEQDEVSCIKLHLINELFRKGLVTAFI